MPSNVTVYDLLISCPGDVMEAVTIIEAVVDGFNQKYNTTLNSGIRTKYWKKVPIHNQAASRKIF